MIELGKFSISYSKTKGVTCSQKGVTNPILMYKGHSSLAKVTCLSIKLSPLTQNMFQKKLIH